MFFHDARVSRRHATISFDGRSWVVEDHGSTNGTFRALAAVQRTELGARHGAEPRQRDRRTARWPTGAQAPAGTPQAQPQQQPYAAQAANAGWAQQAPPAQEPFQQQAPPQQAPQHGQQHGQQHQAQQPGWQQAPPQQAAPHFPQQQGPGGAAGAPPVDGDRSPTMFHQFSLGRVMRIGRALGRGHLVVSDLQVSRHHAEFHSTPDGRMEIRDLGPHNGTYVNGQPIAKGGSQLLGPTPNIVGVGHSTFQIVGDRLEEFVDPWGLLSPGT
ncbi:FHA domain-containing protein [Streptomyces violaceorubidus]